MARFVIGLRSMQIDEIMSTAPRHPLDLLLGDLFIDHDDAIEEAFALMVANHVTTLPVLGPDGEIVGSVNYTQVLRRLPDAGG